MKPVIRINGEPVSPADVDVVEVEPGVYSVLAGQESFEARVSGSEITIGGQRYDFAIDDPRKGSRSDRAADAHGRASITAAMPGKIVRVLVAVGDHVTAGHGIVVVEAMKMQNELKAPRDGHVTSIEVKENDSVTAGAILAVIE